MASRFATVLKDTILEVNAKRETNFGLPSGLQVGRKNFLSELATKS